MQITRAEVLLAEAVERSQVLPGCKLSGGRWWSYYDARWLTSASTLMDYMVSLAEVWDSGASQSGWPLNRHSDVPRDSPRSWSVGRRRFLASTAVVVVAPVRCCSAALTAAVPRLPIGPERVALRRGDDLRRSRCHRREPHEAARLLCQCYVHSS